MSEVADKTPSSQGTSPKRQPPWGKIVFGVTICMVAIMRIQTDSYFLTSRSAALLEANGIESHEAVKRPTALTSENLCGPCKRAVVGNHFTCTARIDRYMLDPAVDLEMAQKIVSREKNQCSVCDPDTCRVEEGASGAMTNVTYSSNRTAVFVHIGKSGGETIKTILAAGCRSRMNPKTREDCLRNLPISHLSAGVEGYTHCFNWYPKPSIVGRASSYLFNLRHPLDRAVSWYHYIHPDLCDKQEGAGSEQCKYSRELAADPEIWVGKFYRQCFPTVQHWAAAITMDPGDHISLLPVDVSTGVNCSQLALDTLRGSLEFKNEHSAAAHMIANLHNNSRLTIGQYPEKEVLVVRTRYMWDDLLDLNLWLGGGRDDFGSLLGSAFNTRVNEKRESVFSGKVARSLCCVLAEEMLAYKDLIQRAANLDQSTKDEELAYLANQCGSPSWSDWIDICGVEE